MSHILSYRTIASETGREQRWELLDTIGAVYVLVPIESDGSKL